MPLDARELDGRLKKLRKGLKQFNRNPTVEEVHSLRTRTRRVESILHALELDTSGNERQVLDSLGEIRKRAGKVRDMDVLTGYVIELEVEDDPNCLVRLVHHLGFERHRQAAKLYSSVQQHAPELRDRLKRTRKKVESAVNRFAKGKVGLDSGGEGDDAPLHAMSVALRLSRELGAVSRLGARNLHAYRLEVKRLRYVLEMAGEDNGKRQDFIDHLKQVQDSIGEWHDWLELGSIAHEVLQHQGGCSLLREIEHTTRTKFNEALRITEQMRHRYLQPPSTQRRGKGKRGRVTPIAGPVLVATSEIAA